MIKTRRRSWLIDPRQRSCRIGYWDVWLALAMLFTAIVVPYEIALLDPKLDELYIVNRVVDGIFAIDIVINFLLMSEVSPGVRLGSVWLTTPWPIAKAYLTSWFVVDAVGVGVSAIDIYVVAYGDGSGGSSDSSIGGVIGGYTSGNSLSKVRVLRLLRVLRLFKLARLLKTSRLAKRVLVRFDVNYRLLSLAKSVLGVIFLSHWLACAWVLQAFIASDSPIGIRHADAGSGDAAGEQHSAGGPYAEYAEPPSWLGDPGAMQFCWSDGTATGYACLPHYTIYSASLYWAVTTITSIGYGDITATRGNVREMIVATVLMLLSALMWGQVIGTYCGVVATGSPEETAFHQTLDDLNRLMAREGMPPAMRRRLREYFHASKHLWLAESQAKLIAHMSPGLQGEVSVSTAPWLGKIWFLKSAPQDFMVELATSLQAMVFAPQDRPPNGFLYMVHRGVAFLNGKLLTKGRMWGEDVILESAYLRVTTQARAMSYLEVYFASRRLLIDVAAAYPTVLRSIRRAAILMALRREIILLAKVRDGGDEAFQAGVKLGLGRRASSARQSRLEPGVGYAAGTDLLGAAVGALHADDPEHVNSTPKVSALAAESFAARAEDAKRRAAEAVRLASLAPGLDVDESEYLYAEPTQADLDQDAEATHGTMGHVVVRAGPRAAMQTGKFNTNAAQRRRASTCGTAAPGAYGRQREASDAEPGGADAAGASSPTGPSVGAALLPGATGRPSPAAAGEAHSFEAEIEAEIDERCAEWDRAHVALQEQVGHLEHLTTLATRTIDVLMSALSQTRSPEDEATPRSAAQLAEAAMAAQPSLQPPQAPPLETPAGAAIAHGAAVSATGGAGLPTEGVAGPSGRRRRKHRSKRRADADAGAVVQGLPLPQGPPPPQGPPVLEEAGAAPRPVVKLGGAAALRTEAGRVMDQRLGREGRGGRGAAPEADYWRPPQSYATSPPPLPSAVASQAERAAYLRRRDEALFPASTFLRSLPWKEPDLDA